MSSIAEEDEQNEPAEANDESENDEVILTPSNVAELQRLKAKDDAKRNYQREYMRRYRHKSKSTSQAQSVNGERAESNEFAEHPKDNGFADVPNYQSEQLQKQLQLVMEQSQQQQQELERLKQRTRKNGDPFPELPRESEKDYYLDDNGYAVPKYDKPAPPKKPMRIVQTYDGCVYEPLDEPPPFPALPPEPIKPLKNSGFDIPHQHFQEVEGRIESMARRLGDWIERGVGSGTLNININYLIQGIMKRQGVTNQLDFMIYTLTNS
jgi:hypothetical protein